jgi:hypothetical protein
MQQSDFARAPERGTNRKNLERVKERLWFYSFYFCSQRKTWSCICFACNGVQALHKHLTRFSATGSERPAEVARTGLIQSVAKIPMRFLFIKRFCGKSDEIRGGSGI